MTASADLTALAEEELARALSLSWRDLARVTPWGDRYEGISPAGREVIVERGYIWAEAPGGDIQCEIAVYAGDTRYDSGARLSRRIAREG